MYESPIRVYENFIHDIAKQKDEHILQAIVKVGIDVNKEELIKALQYDREQYHKGFEDGYKDGARALAEMLANDWISNMYYCDDLDITDWIGELLNELVGE